jgi:hypothetical protein
VTLALIALTWVLVVAGQVFRAKQLAAQASLIAALKASNAEKDIALGQVLAWNQHAAQAQRDETWLRWLPANEQADAVTRGSIH